MMVRAVLGVVCVFALLGGSPMAAAESHGYGLPASISLDGPWRIAFDEAAAWHSGPTAVDWDAVTAAATTEIDVPSCWEVIRPDYDGVAWYVRSFDLPAAALSGTRVRLRFAAVNYLAHVWVNRSYAGAHEGGYTPFELDVTDLLRGGSNHLAVRVLSPHRTREIDGIVAGGTASNMKDLHVPQAKQIRYDHHFGGIWQGVELLITGPAQIADCYIRPFIDPPSIDVRLAVRADWGAAAGSVEISVTDKATATTVYKGEVSVSAEVDATALKLSAQDGDLAGSMTIPLPDAKLWSLSEPNLYVLQATLRDSSGRVSDRRAVPFGLREFTVRGGHFRLNGEPLVVMGAFSQGFYPITLGAPQSEEMLLREVHLAKEAGMHMIRMHIKTPHPRLLDFADEEGLLLFNESSIAWMAETPRLEEHCRREVREMILRDRNHPSVVIWGLLNEGGRDAHKVLPAILDEARRWDDSRVILQDSGRSRPVWLPYVDEPTDELPDTHGYRRSPVDGAVWDELRGARGFVTEAGYGGLFDLVSVVRRYEEAGARPDLLDARQYIAGMLLFAEKANEYGLSPIFGSLENLFAATQEIEAVGTRLHTEARRLSPALAGVTNTYVGNSWEHFGMLDVWRQPKQLYHALAEAYKPLIVVVWPRRPSVYSTDEVAFDLWYVNDGGSTGEARLSWVFVDTGGHRITPVTEGEARVRLRPGINQLDPIVLPREVCDGCRAGLYALQLKLTSSEDGTVLSTNACTVLILHRAGSPAPRVPFAVVASSDFVSKLRALGLSGAGAAEVESADLLLWYDRSERGAESLRCVADRAAGGATAVLLISDSPYHKPDAIVDELPTHARATGLDLDVVRSEGSFIGYYHYVRAHPMTAGLPANCLMGQVYRDVCARESLRGSFQPGTEYVVGAFTSTWGAFRFEHSADLAAMPYGEGRLILTTIPIGRLLGADPIADRLLCNIVSYAAGAGR